MNHKSLGRKLLLASAGLLAMPGLALAGAWSLGGVPATGPVGGGVVSPVVQVRFAGDGTTNDAQTSITIPAGFSAAAAQVNGGVCAVVGSQVNATTSSGAVLPAGPTDFCDVTFTVLAATAAGSYDITTAALPATGCFDAGGTDVVPCTPIANGTGALNVSAGPQPAYTSAPTAPGGTISIVDVIGGGATTATLTVTNTGPVGPPAAPVLNIGAGTGLSGVLSIAPAGAQTAAVSTAGVTYTISCAATTTVLDSQTLSFTHDGNNIPSPATYTVNCTGAVGPTAPTASLGAVVQPTGAPVTLGSVANGSVPVNVDTAGVATASLALNCTIPATGASAFTITGGGTRTINAPATVGNNAPDVGISCVRQIATVNATLSCAQTANPGPSPAALTAVVTCPAGTVAPNYVSTPTPGGTITANAVTGQTATGALAISNTGTATLNVNNCTASAGFTITSPVFPAAIPAGGNTSVVFTCVAPAVGATDVGTLSCTHDATNVTSPADYVLNCTGRSAVVPAMSGIGKILLASLVIGLGLLGMGLRRQA